MFVFRHNHAGSGGHILHTCFLGSLTGRRSEDLAGLFAPDGVMRIVDMDTGGTFDSACGRAGVASLARSVHENIQLADFRTSGVAWSAGALGYAWTASVRNWGSGPARRTSGRIRIAFAGEGVTRADFAMDARVWRDLVRPQARDVVRGSSTGHDFLLAI